MSVPRGLVSVRNRVLEFARASCLEQQQNMNHACTTTLVVSLLCAARTVAAQGSGDTASARRRLRGDRVDGRSSRVFRRASEEHGRERCDDDVATPPPTGWIREPGRRRRPVRRRCAAGRFNQTCFQTRGTRGRAAGARADRSSRRSERDTTGAHRSDADQRAGLAPDEFRSLQLAGRTRGPIYPTGFGQYFRLSSKELRSFIQVERVQ